MYYTYVLYSKVGKKLYIGYSSDLKKRMKQHAVAKPEYRLCYYEAYQSNYDARKREINLKKFGLAYGLLKKRIVKKLGVLEEAGLKTPSRLGG